ncbi:MAG: phytoene/squalene synthase family protein [Rhodothermales bacterium]
MPEAPASSDVPRPFYSDPWRSTTRPAAEALWRWHLAWKQAAEQAAKGAADVQAPFRHARDYVANGEAVEVVPADVQEAAYAACRAHRIPLDVLADQAAAAAHFTGPIRFADRETFQTFIEQWAMPLGEALVRLAGSRGSWQIGQAREAARGFFLTGRLAELPRDLEKDRLFIPQSDLDLAGVSVDQLRAGEVDGAMQKLLWKQVVRARDAFAQGQPLVHELPRRYAHALKRWLLGGLEWLSEIERRGYDVWASPISLSPFRKAQVRFQAQFGRATFRKR